MSDIHPPLLEIDGLQVGFDTEAGRVRAVDGVSLSIGSADPLDMDYLAQIRRLAQRIEPAWIGVPVVVVVIGFLLTAGHWLLPRRHRR